MGAASLRHSTIANASAATSKVVKALLRIVKRRYIKYHAFAFLPLTNRRRHQECRRTALAYPGSTGRS